MRIYEDLRVVQARLGVLQYVAVLGLLALLLQFWSLQVLKGREYQAKAETNRIRTVPIAAPRGPLLDRQGRVLVENRPSFNIVLTPEHSEDLDRATVRLARFLRMGEAQIRERVARRSSPFRPVVIKSDASVEDVAAVAARRLELPEAAIEVVPLRSYPLAAAAAHTLGYVGEVSERQLASSEFAGLEAGNLVGQAGIESQYNRHLMGKDGSRRVTVNSRGVEVAEVGRERPTDGPSLSLTIDAGLQAAMERAFGGRAGSAVALDPETGDVLGMTSLPAYDPNQFTSGIDPVRLGRLSSDPANPFMNRVLQGQYAPGSLFKVVMAAAALEEGVITPKTTFYCPGYLAIYDTVFRCHNASGHGVMDVHRALAQSCNVFFYQVGVRLEIERIARWARRFGLGSPSGIDLPHEASGLVPSPEWKLKTQRVPWYAGETVSVAIGQGQVSVTPLQVALLGAVIASGGRLPHPHVVRAVGGVPIPWEEPEPIGLKPETIEVVREGMRAVVAEGTGWRAQILGVTVAGKTGSAQVVAHARLQRGGGDEIQPHAWFVCFAPIEKPRIALAVLVEHGGAGGEAAAPLAREILSYYLRNAPPPAAAAATTRGQ